MRTAFRIQNPVSGIRHSVFGIRRTVPVTWSRIAAMGALFGLALVTACSSAKTHVDKGRITARSFSFLATSRPMPDYAEANRQAHAMVQQAIALNLAVKGLGYMPAGGEVTVAYLIVAGNNTTTTSLNQYFGYTDDASDLVDSIHKEQTSSQQNRGYFEAGTLVIDFLDPQTSKLLQRRSIHAQILRNLPAETRATRIQSLVDQALVNVPISTR